MYPRHTKHLQTGFYWCCARFYFISNKDKPNQPTNPFFDQFPCHLRQWVINMHYIACTLISTFTCFMFQVCPCQITLLACYYFILLGSWCQYQYTGRRPLKVVIHKITLLFIVMINNIHTTVFNLLMVNISSTNIFDNLTQVVVGYI